MILRRLILFIALLLIASPALAESAKSASRVENVAFSRDGQVLAVSFEVTGFSDERLKKSLESGLPLRFTYTIRLLRTDKALWEGDSVFLTFERVLEKDNLKNRYTLSDGEEKRNFEVADDALLAMGRVDKYPVCEIERLGAKNKYRSEIQVKFEEFRLPFFLHRFLPFVSLGDLKTPWKNEPVPQELYK